MEVIRPGMVLVEDDAGKTCNRETVARLVRKTLTYSSIDFDDTTEMIGQSEVRHEAYHCVFRLLAQRALT